MQSDIRAIKEVIRDVLLNELLPLVLQALKTTDSSGQPLLSRHQAAAMLGVSVQTIAALLRDGVIEHIRVRRRVLIKLGSLHAYMERHSMAHQGGGQ